MLITPLSRLSSARPFSSLRDSPRSAPLSATKVSPKEFGIGVRSNGQLLGSVFYRTISNVLFARDLSAETHIVARMLALELSDLGRSQGLEALWIETTKESYASAQLLELGFVLAAYYREGQFENECSLIEWWRISLAAPMQSADSPYGRAMMWDAPR